MVTENSMRVLGVYIACRNAVAVHRAFFRDTHHFTTGWEEGIIGCMSWTLQGENGRVANPPYERLTEPYRV